LYHFSGSAALEQLGYIQKEIEATSFATAASSYIREQIRDMRIHFLWWQGCPSYPEAWQRLQQVLDELDIEAQVENIEIQTEEEAELWHFPGSPTILVNDQDIDPTAPPAYRLTCRLYFREDGRPSPLPSKEMIRQAVLRAANRKE